MVGRQAINRFTGVHEMKKIIVYDGDLEGAIKRFRRYCQEAGILAELKKHATYEKPGDRKRRIKKEQAHRAKIAKGKA